MIKIRTLFFTYILFSTVLFSQQLQSNINLSDSLSVDSTGVNISDTLANNVKRDTLRPVYYNGFLTDEDSGSKMTKNQINKMDYRFLGDIIGQIPSCYNIDIGSSGIPSEVFLYGLGFNNISYLNNGIEITNRYQNALDLNLIQSEYTDIVEVPSLSSGFIYNSKNNPVTVNLISKNKVATRPYSRIKFYQAPDNEGMFDGQFSAYLIRKVNISFGITNQSADSRYENSELSNWMFNTNVRYMPSNSLNVLARYAFTNLNAGLNGGVDVLATPDQLYDNVQADVNFVDRYHKATHHNFSLSSIFEVDSLSYTNLSFYYQYSLDEFRQNENTSDSNDVKIVNNNSYKVYGLNIHQRLNLYPLRLDLIGNYERTNFDVAYSNISSYNSWSLAGKLSASLLSNKISPSFFMKSSGIDNKYYFGFGGDINITATDWLKLNAGTSYFSRNTNRFLDRTSLKTHNNVMILESGVTLFTSNLRLNANYFSINQSDYALGVIDNNDKFIYLNDIIDYNYADVTRNGINLNLEVKLWKLQLQSNSSVYFGESDVIDYTIPTITSSGGFYYIDTLFNNNLALKAGVNYKLYGERGYSVYDFQRMQSAYNTTSNSAIIGYNSEILIGNSFQLDLFVAGTIRRKAIVYLVFENLLDAQYYVTPYYPVRPQGFRFGVAWEFFD